MQRFEFESLVHGDERRRAAVEQGFHGFDRGRGAPGVRGVKLRFESVRRKLAAECVFTVHAVPVGRIVKA